MNFTAARLYEAFEGAITTMDELDEVVASLESEQQRYKGRVFAYRGVANADHGFFSSLYRRLWWTDAARAGQSVNEQEPPDEDSLSEAEGRVLAELHRWGLHDA